MIIKIRVFAMFTWLAFIALAGTGTASVAAGGSSSGPSGGAAGAEWGSMDRVVVTGARREEVQSEAVVRTESLGREEIEASGAESLEEVLDGFPGIRIERSFAGAGVQIRGLDAQHTLILVDGQRMNGRVDGVFDLSRIPAERIERVEVVKGPASALYGSDALGGVINIITKDAARPLEAWARVAAGSLEDRRTGLLSVGGPSTLDVSTRLGARRGGWTGSLTAGFHHQGAFDLAPEDAATTGSELDSFDVETSHRFTLSPDVRLDLRADLFRRELAGIELGAPLNQAAVEDPVFRDPDARARFDRRNQTTTWSVAAGPRIDLAPGHRLVFTGTYSRFRDDFVRDQVGDDGSDLAQTTIDELALLTGQYDGQIAESHLLTAGIETLYETVASPRLREGQGERGRFSVYAQHEWRILPELQLVPGARLELDSQFGVYPAPKISARYSPFEALGFRASYGLGFRAPAVRELFLVFENPAAGYTVVGNPNLDPELSRGLTASIQLRKPDGLFEGSSFEAEFYRNDVEDLIVFQLDQTANDGTQTFTNENVESALTQGVELLWTMRWVRALGTELGYTYLDARDLSRDRTLPGRSRHRFTFRTFFDHRAIGFSAWVRGVWASRAPLFTDLDSGTETIFIPAFVTLDARVQKTIGDYVSAFVGGDNLTDAGDAAVLPILPRSVFAGLEGRY